MTKKFIAGGCSFTFGHELSDDDKGKFPSQFSWAHLLKQECLPESQYVCTARAGAGNGAIARRVFECVSEEKQNVGMVVVMWSFLSRYEWAMSRNNELDSGRWVDISPWDTSDAENESYKVLATDEIQSKLFNTRRQVYKNAGATDLADAIYRHGANQYHEVYQSLKNIIWLQNILEKMEIPFFFTLADNSLFYDNFKSHCELDQLMRGLQEQLDMSRWFSFGERMMGFNQWSLLENYPRGTTHPLDQAHADAVKLMLPTAKKIIGGKND